MHNWTHCFRVTFASSKGMAMNSSLKHVLGIGLLIMSETSTASAASSILFETSQGRVEVKLLTDIAPNVARIAACV